ncbi:MAG: slipin family protein [Coriobacteriales bacterium]|jgi:regulator of protease activity HflC (stomatin/prohibitin superfamily)|nr:slipin family protein [Coriobacteriales bacterium]
MRRRKQADSRNRGNRDNRGNRELAPAPSVPQSAETASRVGVGLFQLALFIAVFAAVVAVFWLTTHSLSVVALSTALIVALLGLASVHVAQQWERVAVLRLGRFSRVAGPGPFFTIPLIESCALRVDTRVRTTAFGAEETLTADLVPLDVDAVLYWLVWDAHLACTEVSDFAQTVTLAAQTALRDAIGRGSAAQVAIRRNQLDRELKQALEEKVAPWGITVLSVEIRDILMPQGLQEVMSLEAQAEQRKKARITLMEAEQDISEMLAEMGDTYATHDHALRLRMMHLLYESVKDSGGTVVIPSSFSEAFKDITPDELGGLLKGGLR